MIAMLYIPHCRSNSLVLYVVARGDSSYASIEEVYRLYYCTRPTRACSHYARFLFSLRVAPGRFLVAVVEPSQVTVRHTTRCDAC
jgi:hypothetical protein